VYRIIQGSEVLTLSRDYFRLRKPIDRRVYELARKHCGEQEEWKIGLELLHKKTGASSHYREFKSMIRQLVQNDHLPDYQVSLEDEMVIFRNRMNWQPSKGINPCYLTADKMGKTILVANYGGTAAAFPIQPDGHLNEASSVVEHKGSSTDPVTDPVVWPSKAKLKKKKIRTPKYRVTGYLLDGI